MSTETPSQDCPKCGRFVQDRPNYGLHCECGWKNLRGSGAMPRSVAASYPFPAGRDPDEWHRKCRERLFAHHPGPPMRLAWGAYGIESGDRLTWRRRVWTVTNTARWPEDDGHTLDLESSDGGSQRVRVPWHFTGWSRDPGERVDVLTSPHYPACGQCGEPWPCSDVDEGFAATRAVNALIADVQREADYPVQCPEGCRQRFKTERGARQHVARSRIHR